MYVQVKRTSSKFVFQGDILLLGHCQCKLGYSSDVKSACSMAMVAKWNQQTPIEWPKYIGFNVTSAPAGGKQLFSNPPRHPPNIQLSTMDRTVQKHQVKQLAAKTVSLLRSSEFPDQQICFSRTTDLFLSRSPLFDTSSSPTPSIPEVFFAHVSCWVPPAARWTSVRGARRRTERPRQWFSSYERWPPTY